MKKAKDLENSPANLCTPKDLAYFAREEAQKLNVKCVSFFNLIKPLDTKGKNIKYILKSQWN